MKIVRWITFSPIFVAIISILLLTLKVFYEFITTSNKISSDSIIYLCVYPIGMFFIWFVAIIISCLIAPNYRIRISVIYYVITCLFVANSMNELTYEVMSAWYTILAYISSVLGAIGSIFYLKYKLKESFWKFTKTAFGFILFGSVWIVTDVIFIASNPGTEYGYFSEGGVTAFLVGVIYMIISSAIHFKSSKNKKSNKHSSNLKYLP